MNRQKLATRHFPYGRRNKAESEDEFVFVDVIEEKPQQKPGVTRVMSVYKKCRISMCYLASLLRRGAPTCRASAIFCEGDFLALRA